MPFHINSFYLSAQLNWIKYNYKHVSRYYFFTSNLQSVIINFSRAHFNLFYKIPNTQTPICLHIFQLPPGALYKHLIS